MSNTIIGSSFSLLKVNAVVSIIFKPFFIVSSKEISSNLIASLFFSGSSLYIPSTLVPFRITSALISIALKTAAESVVKYGLPVPDAKITTRPFSKCLVAFLLINGSAIDSIFIADWSLVGISIFSSAF